MQADLLQQRTELERKHRITEALLKKASAQLGPSSVALEAKMEALRRWESAFNEKVRRRRRRQQQRQQHPTLTLPLTPTLSLTLAPTPLTRFTQAPTPLTRFTCSRRSEHGSIGSLPSSRHDRPHP